MPFRPLPFCVAAGMIAGGLSPADAQPALPTGLPPLAQAQAQPSPVQSSIPPARVGRIAAVTGPVSFHLAGATEWQVASPNLPITDGTALWVAPGGEAALGVGSGNRVVLGPTTEFSVDRLDEQTLLATQAQGESYLHLRLVQPGETYTVQTPRGIVTIASAGRYEIVSGDTEHPTTITVLEGAATLSGVPTTAEIGANQTLTITGDGAATTPFTPSLGPAVQDEFLRHALAEERPPAARPAQAPAVIAYMTGADALDDVGEWSDNAEYGPVWYPPVANYVPYRQGRWAYVAPWGWTWVDDASWGFAPTHYGRWSQFDGRWGWVPGRDWAPDRRPVYAPALVGFLGGAALGYGRGPAVGWAPLGPRDAYRPTYAVNDRIIQVLNQPTGANFRGGNGPVTINRSAITIVPTQVLTNSAQVAGAIRPGPLPPSLGPSSVLQFRPQAVPTRATIGATQTVLRQVNPPGLAAPAAHIGPGPALGPALGQAPPRGPQIGPAALFGGAAAGALAGSLLRPPPPRNAGLPELHTRGEGAPAPGGGFRGAAFPRPPAAPSVPGPVAPRGPGPMPAVIYGGGGPGPGRVEMPRQEGAPGPNRAPRLPQVISPPVEPGLVQQREEFARPRGEQGFAPRQQQQFAPPGERGQPQRREEFARPRGEPGFAPPQQQQRAAPPGRENFGGPHPVAAPSRPEPPQMQRMGPAGPPPGQHAPAPEGPRGGGGGGRPERP